MAPEPRPVHSTVLITGASSGIGRELARLFARDGSDLVLVARNRPQLEELARELERECKVQVIVMVRDLAELSAAREIADELSRLSIEIDTLVNSAGTQVYGEFAGQVLDELLAMIRVNAAALVALTHLLLPGMISRHRGRILNLGSTGSFAPGPLNAVYCATKAFVLSFSEAIGAELAGSGVTVTALCPGATASDFAARHGMQDVRYFENSMSPVEAAQIGYRALRKGRPLVVAGLRNQLEVLSFQLAAPFLGLTPPAWLWAIGRRYMGRTGSNQTRGRSG